MPIQKLILTCIIFAATLLGSVLAADKPATQADTDKLQEQVRTLDKELAVQREAFVRKLDDVEKRQNEITAQQANSLAAIANQTATIGNHITNTSILITVLVLGAGFITYFSAKGRAEKEAREASKQWFEENTIKLTRQIETFRTEATTAAAHIKNQVQQVTSNAAVATENINAAVATAILSASKASLTGESTPPADSQAVQVVTEASQSLKSKPESQFTANDFFTRGLSYFSNQDFHAALSAFESAIQLSAADTPPDRIARYLFAKGITLGQLDKSQDEIAVYDELDKRFGADTNSAVRELVANGLNGAGFNRILLAKQCWPDEARRVELLLAATTGLERAVLQCSDEDRTTALGNLGYSLFLSGDRRAAEAPTLECLRLGGQKALEAQRKDATLHRVEPEDSQYEELLNRLWQSLPPKTVAS